MRLEPTTALRRPVQTPRIDAETLAAIAFVIGAENQRRFNFEEQRITVRDEDNGNMWGVVGKMRAVSRRLGK